MSGYWEGVRGGECEGNAFGSVCLFVCLSESVTQKYCSDLFDSLHKSEYTRGSVLL